MLTIDDGLAPNGGLIASFAMVAGGTSAVSIFDTSTGGESLREYNASTGAYGRVFATDPSATGGYQIIGIDPGVHRLLVLHWTSAAAPSLQTYDTHTTELLSDVSTGSQYTVLGGRVDRIRHRAAILAHRTSDNADIVLPLTLSTGTLGTPIEVDTSDVLTGGYKAIAMDQVTGLVYLSRTNIVDGVPVCFGGGEGTLISLDLDSHALTSAQDGNVCVTGLDVDDNADQVFETAYNWASLRLPLTTALSGFAGDTLNDLPVDAAMRPGKLPIGLVIDSTRHLGLVAYQLSTEAGDNNATSQTDIVDLTTGNTVSVVSNFNFVTGFFGGQFNQTNDLPIQLDAATRTGWTISGDGRQIQQFKY